MGSSEGIRKMREKMIEKYGSLEAYKEEQRRRASKGGKRGENGYSTISPEMRREYGRMGGKAKKKSVK